MEKAVEVSVVIPTYNRAKMVCECVATVLAQEEVALEAIVVDDCSPDNTGNLIKERFGGDERVIYVRTCKQSEISTVSFIFDKPQTLSTPLHKVERSNQTSHHLNMI